MYKFIIFLIHTKLPFSAAAAMNDECNELNNTFNTDHRSPIFKRKQKPTD